MRSPLKEICVETLRARYAELLRLREYVERLEELHNAKSDSGGMANDIAEPQLLNAPRVIGLFG